MRLKSYDLVIVMVLAIGVLMLTLTGVSDMRLRAVFVLPFVLVAPGYALTEAMFASQMAETPERLLLMLGLSPAISIVGGLVINWTRWALQANTWAALLCSVTLGASLVALFRRRKRPVVDLVRVKTGLRTRQVVLFGLAALVVIGAIAVAHKGVFQQYATTGFTQLWILSDHEIEHTSVRIGVRSMEPRAKRYGLKVEVSGKVIREWPLINLEPGRLWEDTVVLPTRYAEAGTVKAVLYLLDDPEVAYRHVELWSGAVEK